MCGIVLALLLTSFVVCSQSLKQCNTTSGAMDADALVFPPKHGSKTGRKLYITGVFPLHKKGKDSYTCGEIDPIQVLRLHAFEWAIHTASSRLAVKPKVTVGGVGVDSCDNVLQLMSDVSGIERCRAIIQNNNTELDRRFITAYVDFHTHLSILDNSRIENTLSSYGKPVFRLTSSTSTTNSGVYYRSGAIGLQIEGLVNVIMSVKNERHYSIVLYSDTEYHASLYNTFRRISSQASLCTTSDKISTYTDFKKIASDIIDKRSYRFLVLFLTDYDLRMMLDVMDDGTGEDSIAFSVILLMPDISPAYKQMLYKSRLGSVLIEYTHEGLNNLKNDTESFIANYQHLKPNESMISHKYFSELWKTKFGCVNSTQCLARNSLTEADIQVNIEDVVFGVDILIDGFEKARQLVCSGNITCDELGDWTNSSRVREAVSKATPYNTRVFGNDTNYPTASFKLLQLRPLKPSLNLLRQFIQVGTLKADGTVIIIGKGIQAYDENGNSYPATSHCPSKQENLCRQCGSANSSTSKPTTTGPIGDRQYMIFKGQPAVQNLPVGYEISGSVLTQKRPRSSYGDRYTVNEQTWIIALAVCAGIGMIAVIILEIRMIYRAYKEVYIDNDVFIKFRTLLIGQVLLLGIFLSYLTLIAFIFVPSAASCGIIRFCVGFFYAMCLSLLIVKLLILLKSRTSEEYLTGDDDSSNYFKIQYQLIIFLAALAVQVAIGVQWLLNVPPGVVLVRSYGNEPVWICNHYTWSVGNSFWDMSKFVRVNTINHIISLTFISVLFVIAFILALRAQGIVTNLRESRFILFAIIFSIPVWITWQLVGGLIHDFQHAYAHEIADAATAFGLFLIASIILITMFVPKPRQIINIGLEGVYLEDDKDAKFYDTSSIPLSRRDVANGSSYFIADRSIVDGNVSIISPAPLSLETSYSTPLREYVKDISAYSTLDNRNREYDRTYASSTLGRNQEPTIFYSEIQSPYENDPRELHAKHPMSNKPSSLHQSTPNITFVPPAGTISRHPSTLNRSTDSIPGRTKTLKLSHDLTGRRQAHTTMFPSYESEVDSPRSTLRFNHSKRSKSVDGLVGSL